MNKKKLLCVTFLNRVEKRHLYAQPTANNEKKNYPNNNKRFNETYLENFDYLLQ